MLRRCLSMLVPCNASQQSQQLLAVLAGPQLQQQYAASSSRQNGSSLPADATPQGADEYYWIPDAPGPSPASVAQRRAAGRLEAAVESLLLGDAALREQLVDRFGLNIHRLQLSKDRRSVFLLWDALPGQAPACEAALQRNAFRLRRQLARLLGSKHTPYLEFRHDHLPPLQAAVASAMELVEQELAADAAAAAAAADGGGAAADSSAAGSSGSNSGVHAAGSAAGLDAAAVEAAIARLEVVTAPRPWAAGGDVQQQQQQEQDGAWDEWEEGAEEGDQELQQLLLLQEQLQQQQQDDGDDVLEGENDQQQELARDACKQRAV